MEFKNDKAIYLQIGNYICEKILQKHWLPGERIPSVRELSVTLAVNPNTVMRAFELLDSTGIIFNKRGLGFFVAEDACPKIQELYKKEFMEKDLPDFFKKIDLLHIDWAEMSSRIENHLKNKLAGPKMLWLTMLFLCFLLGGKTSMMAQGSIRGVIVDQSDKKPILYANVVLAKVKDSIQITGTATNDNGEFKFTKVPNGKYFVQFSTIGYHRSNSAVVEISNAQKDVDLGSLELSPSATQLQEVVVAAKRPVIEQMAGKMVMNVGSSTLLTNDNVYEMLKKFPGIVIDHNDNLTYNGQSGILILIDDRDSRMSGTDLMNMLKSMSSSNVQKIEAMENPSAKYDAEGVSGIINIVTKKREDRGFTGTANVGAGYWRNLKHNESLNLNWRSPKLVVYADASYYHQKSENGMEEIRQFADQTRYESNSKDGEFWSSNGVYGGVWGKAGADYYIDKQNIISATYSVSGGSGTQNSSVYTRILSPQQVITNAFSQVASSEWRQQNHNTNINFQHILDTVYKRQLLMDASWVHNLRGGVGGNKIRYFLGDFQNLSSEEGYDMEQPLISDIFSLKADYEHPFANRKAKLEAGVKASYTFNDNNMEYIQDGVLSTDLSNQYLYREAIGAAYAIFHYTFSPKTSIQAGLRGEYTYFTGHNIELDSTNSDSYFRLFPNVSLSHQIGTQHRLNFSYRYRLSRPRYFNLNPFVVRNQTNDYSAGNPFLKPSYAHSLTLGYSLGYRFFANLSYSHSDGTVSQLKYYNDSTHSTLSIPQNIGTSDMFNLSVNTQFTFFDIWQLMLYAGGSYGKAKINYLDRTEVRTNINAYFWFNTSVEIIPTLSAELSGWGNLPGQRNFSKQRGNYAINLGVKKTFLDKKLTVSISMDDILGTSRWSEEEFMPDGSYAYSSYQWESQTLWVRLQYRFGNNAIKAPNRRSLSGDNEESSRLGGSGQEGQGGGGR